MSDLELDLEPGPHETRPFQRSPEEPPQNGGGKAWIGIAAAVVLGGALAAYFLFLREPSSPEPAVAEAPPVTAPARPAPPAAPKESSGRYAFEGELPPLDRSDQAIGKVVSTLSSHPRLLTWMATPELARTFAVMIENIAADGNPSQHLRFLAPEGDFAVRDDEGTLRAAAENQQRYELATTVFTSLDPEGCAAAYEHLKPLLEEAFAELGYPRQAFEPSLEQAFANILAVEVPSRDPELEKDVTTYSYADPQLEALSPLAKQLLRMGPDNARRIQRQARRLAEALGMDV